MHQVITPKPIAVDSTLPCYLPMSSTFAFIKITIIFFTIRISHMSFEVYFILASFPIINILFPVFSLSDLFSLTMSLTALPFTYVSVSGVLFSKCPLFCCKSIILDVSFICVTILKGNLLENWWWWWWFNLLFLQYF